MLTVQRVILCRFGVEATEEDINRIIEAIEEDYGRTDATDSKSLRTARGADKRQDKNTRPCCSKSLVCH